MQTLNPSQRAAVEHTEGPLLVLAGAGSGKTRVVTARIANLVSRGVPARAILAVTFTNKAAAEMRERVAHQIGEKLAAEITVSTFHSFGLRMLAAETTALGMQGGEFAIYDQGDVLGLLRELARNVDVGRKLDLGAVLARISAAKNQFLEADAMPEREGDDYDLVAKVLYPRYEAALRAHHAFDFDDLVCEPVRLMRRRDDVRERWQARFRYLMVDEYQDTNHAQLELVRMLGDAHKNVCVVGDDDQSIYAWRGADVTNILDFEEHFPGATIVRLEDNYRSRASVLSVANAVLAASTARRHEKTLRAAREGGDKVRMVVLPDPDAEAAFVASEIADLRDAGVRPRDVAVLYRSNAQSEPIESALRERQVPYRVFGGTQFYDRKEVKDLLAYLKLTVAPRDEIALRRVVNYPARGIGESALERLSMHATAREISLWEALRRARTIDGLSGAAADGALHLVSIVEEARAALEAGRTAEASARELARAVGLYEDIEQGSGSATQAARRRGNLDALYVVLARHDARMRDNAEKRPTQKLAELLRLLALTQNEEDEDARASFVTMTTMHGAKGLEFPHVFLIGLEDGILPHERALAGRATDVGGAHANDVEEERRLFYVSLTRAKDKLTLSRCKYRLARGKPMPRIPSRFLAAVPDELLDASEREGAPKAASLGTSASAAAALLAAIRKIG